MFTISARSSATRRIAAVLAGPAVIAGVLGGALALGSPANAAPAASNEATCTTAKVVASPSSLSSLLTRPGQLNNAQANREPVTATSCVGH